MAANPHRRDFLSYSLALALPVANSTATAQTPPAWPSKSIKLWVPNPAGGSADMFPRWIAEPLATKLGQVVVVDNKPGAAGNIAAEYIYNAEPDGYTLMAAPPPSLSINVSLYPKINYDPAKFTPITILCMVPNALMVHPSVPANTVQELIQYAKANPDKLSYASQGNGSTSHLTAEMFKQKTGVRMVHVPYKGDAPAMADLLAGHVQLMFGNVSQATSHLRTGKLKMLAVTSSKRQSQLPQVPAMQEIVPGVIAVTWFAVVAPPKTPAAIAQKLSTALAEVLRSPDVARRFAEAGAEPVGNTPEEMAQWMREDTERWRQVIKNGGVTID